MSTDVVVIGAGAIGSSIAWRTAATGLSVTVVDDSPERAASRAAAGMLAPVTEVHYGEERLLQLNLLSAEMYPDFVAELEQVTGKDVGYTKCGTLIVARDIDENRALDDLFAFQLKLGLEVERLRARDCRELEPALSPTVRGGILVPGDHQIDNRALMDALEIACERADVERVSERVVIIEPGGVRLGNGDSIAASTVVLSAGSWSGQIEGLSDDLLTDLRPVKGQLLHLRGRLPIARRTLRGAGVYLVMRPDGRVVVGATVEEQGFDTSVTVEAVYTLLRDAYELLPGIVDLELVEIAVGLRPGRSDNAPIIGRTDREGLLIATGHYRNGILLVPATSAAVAESIVAGSEPDYIAPFGPVTEVRTDR